MIKAAMLKAVAARMILTKKSFSNSTKSPTIIAGLFCLLYLVSDYRRDATPSDVTITFWIALSENNKKLAKEHSIIGSEPFSNERLYNASLQIGDVNIQENYAVVETFISRESAASSSSFQTYLTRTQDSAPWKVDYQLTLSNIKDKEFESIFDIIINFKERTLAPLVAWLRNKENPRLRRLRDRFRNR